MALRATEKSRQLDPDDFEMPTALSSFYLDMGDVERAATWVDTAMAVAPEAPTTYTARMELALAQGDQRRATTLAREFLDKKLENRLGAQFIAGEILAWDAYRREDYQAVLDWVRTLDETSFVDPISYQELGQAGLALHLTVSVLRRSGDNARVQGILDAAGDFLSRHEINTPRDEWARISLESLIAWHRGGGDEALAGYVRDLKANPPGQGWWIFMQDPIVEDLAKAPPVAAELAGIEARTRAMGERLRKEDGYVSPTVKASP